MKYGVWFEDWHGEDKHTEDNALEIFETEEEAEAWVDKYDHTLSPEEYYVIGELEEG